MSNTDTSAVDNGQLGAILARMQRDQQAARPFAVHEADNAWMVRDKDGKAWGWFADQSEAADSARSRNGQVPAQAQPVDEQWAGPSLPHPTEATSDDERAELAEGWDNWQHGIDPNQIHEGHYTEEAGI